MTDLIELATEIQRKFDELGWRFCFIGGLAVQCWGEPRLTRDIDISLLTGFGQEEPFVVELLQHYPPRIDDCLQFALKNRVVLLDGGNNIGIDVALAGLAFEQEMINRARLVEVMPGRQLVFCSPEDLIVLKAFASRAVDWHDVETIIARQGKTQLDAGYILTQVSPLAEAKEEPEIVVRLQQLLGE